MQREGTDTGVYPESCRGVIDANVERVRAGAGIGNGQIEYQRKLVPVERHGVSRVYCDASYLNAGRCPRSRSRYRAKRCCDEVHHLGIERKIGLHPLFAILDSVFEPIDELAEDAEPLRDLRVGDEIGNVERCLEDLQELGVPGPRLPRPNPT